MIDNRPGQGAEGAGFVSPLRRGGETVQRGTGPVAVFSAAEKIAIEMDARKATASRAASALRPRRG